MDEEIQNNHDGLTNTHCTKTNSTVMNNNESHKGQEEDSKLMKQVQKDDDLNISLLQKNSDGTSAKRKQSKDALSIYSSSIVSEAEKKSNFICNHCEMKFKVRSLLNRHQKKYKDEKNDCDICEEKFCTILQLKSHKKSVHNIYGKKCKTCSEIFRTPALLVRHIAEKHDGKKLPREQCPKCQTWCRDKLSLKRHMLIHNDEGSIFICNICQKVSANRISLLAHIRFIHNAEKKHECSICNKKYKRKLDLRQHMAKHERKALYKCPYCPRTFYIISNLHVHRKEYHPVEYKEDLENRYINDSLISRTQITTNTDEEQHLPPNSGFKKSANSLIECKFRNISYSRLTTGHRTRRGSRTTAPVSNPRIFKCKFCDKGFKTALCLREHAATHTGIPLYSCSFCSLTFNGRSAVYSHRKIFHMKELQTALLKGEKIKMAKPEILEKYDDGAFECTCKQCGVVVPNFSALATHTSEVHKMEEMYDCHLCKRTFKRRNNLLRHIAYHNKELLYSCSLCPESFTSLKCLNAHNKKLHPDEYKRVFQKRTKKRIKKSDTSNDLLPSSTLSVTLTPDLSSQLAPAQSTASVFQAIPIENSNNYDSNSILHKCNQCDFIGENLIQLLFHKNKYHKKLPTYECDMCQRTFTQKYLFEEHMSIHIGFAQFKCPHCSEPFYTRSKLYIHRKKHHPKEYDEDLKKRQLELKKFSSIGRVEFLQNA